MMDHNNGEENDIEIEGSLRETIDDKKFSSMTQPLLLRNRKNNTSQIAIVGANVFPIESLDYEIIENDLFKQDWRSRKKVEIFQYVFLKWTLALLIGLGTGLVGFFNNIAVENIAGFKLLLTNSLMLENNIAVIVASVCTYFALAMGYIRSASLYKVECN